MNRITRHGCASAAVGALVAAMACARAAIPQERAIDIVGCVPGATFTIERQNPHFLQTAPADANGVAHFALVPNFPGHVADVRFTAPGYGKEFVWTGHPIPDGPRQLLGPCRPLTDRSLQTVLVPFPTPDASAWEPTLSQKLNLQGDLMIWEPALALRCDASGFDPRANIRCVGNGGEVPRGLIAGWVWGLTVVRYSAADREMIYQAALRDGHTHFQIAVSSCGIGGGYHGLMPETAETCATAAMRVNTVLRELRARKLITMCVGPSPSDPVLPGLDHSLCDVVGDDWDNSMAKDCRLNLLGREFPGVPIFLWRMANELTFLADECSPVPFPATNTQWIRAAQRRVPAFAGIFHEVNIPEVGVDGAIAELQNAHETGMRDVPEVLGETDTYWKLFRGLPVSRTRADNDRVRARLPWLAGCFSGCTNRPPLLESGDATVITARGDMIDPNTIQTVNPPDFRAWPVTARITKIAVLTTGLHIEFSKQDAWPDNVTPGWEGPLQYSIGMVLKVNGQWYASAPIECWRNMPTCGGPIQSQNAEGSGTGHIAKNWFYDPRWRELNGYQPRPGEQIGLFVTAGDNRNNFNPLKERSNIVVVPLPADGVSRTFTVTE